MGHTDTISLITGTYTADDGTQLHMRETDTEYRLTIPTDGDGLYYQYLSRDADSTGQHVEPLSDTEFALWHYSSDVSHRLTRTVYHLYDEG